MVEYGLWYDVVKVYCGYCYYCLVYVVGDVGEVVVGFFDYVY